MTDIFDLNTLLAQLVLALGAALTIGNGHALLAHRMGRRPKGAREELRKSRAWFLLIVGVVIAYWGLASLVS
ncbi:MAG: hypothetical protein ACE5KX_02760 [Acidimicrobiia bacterium]